VGAAERWRCDPYKPVGQIAHWPLVERRYDADAMTICDQSRHQVMSVQSDTADNPAKLLSDYAY